MTLTRLAVNYVNFICNKHFLTHTYNDRLKDGRRSLKVLGWGSAQYSRAVDFLLARGCTVRMIKTKQGYLRLHVKE